MNFPWNFKCSGKLLVNFKLQTFSLAVTMFDKLPSSLFALQHTASLAKAKAKVKANCTDVAGGLYHSSFYEMSQVAKVLFGIQYINESAFALMSCGNSYTDGVSVEK
jgi:hypothetical protein